jgi:cytochrome c biogenesis protein
MVSLMVPRRRVWVRATAQGGGRTLVEVAGLARSESGRLSDEVAELTSALAPETPTPEGSAATKE